MHPNNLKNYSQFSKNNGYVFELYYNNNYQIIDNDMLFLLLPNKIWILANVVFMFFKIILFNCCFYHVSLRYCFQIKSFFLTLSFIFLRLASHDNLNRLKQMDLSLSLTVVIRSTVIWSISQYRNLEICLDFGPRAKMLAEISGACLRRAFCNCDNYAFTKKWH